jgi:[ribosomal protein S5]-alanine N-acetyltransferase
MIKTDAMQISARGLTLRLPELEDFDAWHALRETSADYFADIEPDWRPPLDRDSFARNVEDIEKIARERKGYSFLIFNAAGQLVGGITLGPIITDSALLGTWIGAPFVGQGYAIRAVDVVLRFAFDGLRLNKVAATVLPDNNASIRILEWFGFDYEPDRNLVMRVRNDPRLHCFYLVTRDGWERSQSKQSRRGVYRQEGTRDADGE